MSDLSSPITSAQIREASDILLWLCLGIYFSNTLSSLRRDLSFVITRGSFMWSHVPYFASKAGLWAYFLTEIAIRWTDKQLDCQGATYALELLAAICLLSSSTILAHQTAQLQRKQNRKNVVILLAILSSCLVTTWIFGVQGVRAHWDSESGQIWQSGACQLDSINRSFTIKFGISLLFILVMFALSATSKRSVSDEAPRPTFILSLLALFTLNLLIVVLSATDLNPHLDVLFEAPFIAAYSMMAFKSHLDCCSLSEASKTSRIIHQVNRSRLTFDSTQVDNGCKSPFVIQMDGPMDSPTRSNFSRSATPTSGRAPAHSRSAIYLIDGEFETQRELASLSVSGEEGGSSTPIAYADPGDENATLPSSALGPQEATRRCQDPWNQVEPSSILLTPTDPSSASSSASEKAGTSTPSPTPKSPLRCKPYPNRSANKSRRPITPSKKNQAKDQNQERPNTANSFTQRMAIALESNSR